MVKVMLRIFKIQLFAVFSMILLSTSEASSQQKTIQLHFATNSSILDEDELSRTLKLLLERPCDSIELIGHCDFRGSELFNLKLANERLNSVQQWLSNLVLSKKPVEKQRQWVKPILQNPIQIQPAWLPIGWL
jgi:hypothetical protein